jgi:hypothetical protein
MTTSVRRSDGTPSRSPNLGSTSGPSTTMMLRFTKTMARFQGRYESEQSE